MKKRGAKSPDRADALWYSFVDPLADIDARKPGDVVAAETEEFIENGEFWYSGSNGVGAFGW